MLQSAWQGRGTLARALWPLSLLYGALMALRRWLYQAGVLASAHPGCPVIVVGNVIAGGAGKTPVTIALVQHLRACGLHPGVISRGYGRGTADCRPVLPDSPASAVGDEPALIARHCPGTPVFVAPRRIDAARALLAAHPATDVIVCDDGLQHLALRRDMEICVFNDQGVGNGWLLPAGPLREQWPRRVDFVLHSGALPHHSTAPAFALQRTLAPYAVTQGGQRRQLTALRGTPLHAVAAIARPELFFAMLRAQGLNVATCEALPDHYDFNSWNPSSDNGLSLICTEKDAVKIWPQYPDALAVPLQLHIAPAFFEALDARLSSLLAEQGTSPHGPQTA